MRGRIWHIHHPVLLCRIIRIDADLQITAVNRSRRDGQERSGWGHRDLIWTCTIYTGSDASGVNCHGTVQIGISGELPSEPSDKNGPKSSSSKATLTTN